MAVCKVACPQFKDVGNGHFVACHLYDSEVMSNPSYYEELVRKQEEAEAQARAEAQAKKLHLGKKSDK